MSRSEYSATNVDWSMAYPARRGKQKARWATWRCPAGREDGQACKPGSVPRGRAVYGRAFLLRSHGATTIFLGRRLPVASSSQPEGGPGALSPPIWPCSGWGLPSRPVTRPLVRSYRTVAPLPRSSRGGMFLWHFPSGFPAWTLSSTLPGGARTFLSLGMRRRSGRPAYPSRHKYTSVSQPPATAGRARTGRHVSSRKVRRGRIP